MVSVYAVAVHHHNQGCTTAMNTLGCTTAVGMSDTMWWGMQPVAVLAACVCCRLFTAWHWLRTCLVTVLLPSAGWTCSQAWCHTIQECSASLEQYTTGACSPWVGLHQ